MGRCKNQNQIHPNSHVDDEEFALYPRRLDDGGLHKPTKRTDLRSIENPMNLSAVVDEHYADKTCSSKVPDIAVEEMENKLLQTEVARIDSMVMCAEHALAEIKGRSNVGDLDEEMQN